MTEQKPFQVETTIDAPLETVWSALTTPGQIHEWFGWPHDGLDAEIRYIFVDHAEHLPPDRISLAAGQTIQLTTDGRRTVVRLVMAGDLDDAKWADVYDPLEEGWRAFFEQLRFLLERHRSAHRRALHLSGTATGPAALAMLAAAGVKEIWHESRYQQAVLDGDGHLIVVSTTHPLTDTEAGPVGVTVTTYGLTDDSFAAVRQQWTARWQATVGDTEVSVG